MNKFNFVRSCFNFNKLNIKNDSDTAIDDYELKLDLRTATYDEIMAIWSAEQTQYDGQDGAYKLYSDGMLYRVFKTYFGDSFKIDKDEVSD